LNRIYRPTSNPLVDDIDIIDERFPYAPLDLWFEISQGDTRTTSAALLTFRLCSDPAVAESQEEHGTTRGGRRSTPDRGTAVLHTGGTVK
jgi:hypothetical protein